MEILPFLYLGSAYHAARRDMLDALGITALLNVSSDCPNHFEGHYQYKCIPVEDNHKADISSWFMEAIEYIGRLAWAGDWAQGRVGRMRGTTCNWLGEGGVRRGCPGCIPPPILHRKAYPALCRAGIGKLILPGCCWPLGPITFSLHVSRCLDDKAPGMGWKTKSGRIGSFLFLQTETLECIGV